MSAKPLTHLVYLVLERDSDELHPLKYGDIADKITQMGYPCARKSVGRAIETLRSLGHEIAITHAGSYLVSRPLERGELVLLIDSVMGSRHLNGVHTADLIAKISRLGGEHFSTSLPTVEFSHAGKSGNFDFLYNIEELNGAIAAGKKVSFVYSKYGADLQKHPTRLVPHMVSPYRMVLHNQHYYLAGCTDKYGTLTFFRVDKMTRLKVLSERAAPPPPEWTGSEWLEKLTTLPYLYTDKPQRIVLEVDEKMIDELVDWFGMEFQVEKRSAGSMRITLTSSPTAMLYWSLQYGARVKVLQPESLRDRLVDELNAMLARYAPGSAEEAPSAPDTEKKKGGKPCAFPTRKNC